jgi:hypothetical protein
MRPVSTARRSGPERLDPSRRGATGRLRAESEAPVGRTRVPVRLYSLRRGRSGDRNEARKRL